mgnify:CR=1 FL=1
MKNEVCKIRIVADTEEDIFADVGIERRNISKQSTLRVQKRIELKGNVSSRFQDDSDSDVIGDAVAKQNRLLRDQRNMGA